MGKLIVSENMTLDGVTEDPTGDDGIEGGGGWFIRGMGEDRPVWADAEFAEAREASALLMGRRSDAYFGARWNTMPGEWADWSRSLPKYVVSSTIATSVWVNGTVLRGDVVDEVRALKARIDGTILTYASRLLVQTLLEHDLVDELHLTVFPVVAGSGKRLFDGASMERSLRLRSTETVGAGLTRLVYDVVHVD
ncbi:dihydrofolate reductase family protein [Microbacterium terrisoli]|jgi:dihydrofolate reductase|uniref:dihydrofolate reductase family protein n=1 Tax=Microbacterium terrisoli TaxID=3242192 RepID=UPI00280646FC|nr:dihydrofolate reductase family protein [Microbacterium protaetiae]